MCKILVDRLNRFWYTIINKGKGDQKMTNLKKLKILINYYGENHSIPNEYIDDLFENNFEAAEKIWENFKKIVDNPERV